MVKHLIALDPGGTTGVAVFSFDPDGLEDTTLIYLDQIPDGLKGFAEFFQGSTIREDIYVVSEKWVTREGVRGANATPIYIEGYMYSLWPEAVDWQEPKVKSTVPDEMIERLGLWVPGKRHAMDAVAHGLAWLRQNKIKDVLEKLRDGGDILKQLSDARAEKSANEEGEYQAVQEMFDRLKEALKETAEQLAEMCEAAQEASEASEDSKASEASAEPGGEAAQGEELTFYLTDEDKDAEHYGSGYNLTGNVNFASTKDADEVGENLVRDESGVFLGFKDGFAETATEIRI